MAIIESRLKTLGITLPASPRPIGNYVPAVQIHDFLYLSGVGPAPSSDGVEYLGTVDINLTLDEAYQAARLVGINLIARLKDELGDLDRVRRIVKLLSMVNSSPDFCEQPAVANGCSDLLVEVFGDRGRHARSAVGVAALPGNIPIEIEMIVQVDN